MNTDRISLLSSLPPSIPANFLREITDDFSPERELGKGASGTVYKKYSCAVRSHSIDNLEMMSMSYELLKKITDDFSDKRLIGRGTFGVVYKGEDEDGREIAVKVLNSMQGVDDEQFYEECKNLASLNHQNVVPLVGYCNKTEEVPLAHDGKHVIALKMNRAVCFEYMPNGNLQKHLSDEFHGFCWLERYKLIKGICEGLKYLHMRVEGPVYHLDLKPENILLDINMVPKISDFGLSALVVEESVDVIRASGCVPPEFIKFRVISKEFDIFSLGVIILKIMTGHMGYNMIDDMDPAKVIDLVYNKWRKRLLAMQGCTSLKLHCQQVKRCVEIAVKCLEEERCKRPTVGEIIQYLNESEGTAVKGLMHTGENVSYMGRRDTMDNLMPMKMTYQLLKEITNDFSEERILGEGTFGVVYKGMDNDENEVAVKLLKYMQGIDDKEFHREFNNLVKLDHPNIVKLVGFCNEEEEVPIVYEGKQVIAVKMHRALCFEYMQNGSLHNYLYGESEGIGWQERYKIIEGICQGLRYLHTGLRSPIYHLDLKPDNILLDENMVPKIADFGLSRLLGEKNTIRTLSPFGTWGYMPPEFIQFQIISKEFDIFSLGVIIIKIMIGPSGTSDISGMAPAESVEHVHNKWRRRLQSIPQYTSLEMDCLQVKKCIEVAVKCTGERKRRPTIEYIINKLTETEEIRSPHLLSSNLQVKSSKHSSQETATNNSRGDKGPMLLSTLPKEIPASILKDITYNFSEKQQHGLSSFGKVYKGIMADGNVIAVKKLSENSPIANEKSFENEVKNLMAVQHENIVRLVGYCHEAGKELVKKNNRYVIVDKVETLLCYEYLPRGSLERFFSESNTMDWYTRFKVIKGICNGLHFLHREMDFPVVHMNLLPNAIWLDDNFVPKIAEFGLSRLFGAEQTRMYTINVVGAIGFMAPEFVYRGEISTMADIYSLGILILVITTGEKIYPNREDISGRNLVDNVHKNWRQGSCIASNYLSVDANGLRQVKTCIEIGLKCVKLDRKKRPCIEEILKMLNGDHSMDNSDTIGYISPELLDVHPAQLRFQFRPNKFISCSLHITNRTYNFFAIRLLAKGPMYLTKMPIHGTVPPMSTYTLIVTTREQKHLHPNSDEFLTLESSIVSDGDLSFKNEDLDSMAADYGIFFKKAHAEGANKVHELKLKVISIPPEDAASNQIISKKKFRKVLSLDVHPSEPWIITSHHQGEVLIWDYQTQTLCSTLEFTEESVYSVKFVERQQWLLAGDDDGYIYVYSFDAQLVVTSFKAHDTRITSLAVHASRPLLLSSSHDYDHLIKLWDWDKGWESVQRFHGHDNVVTQVDFDPVDTSSFASVSRDATTKIWSISSSECKVTISDHPDHLLCVHNYNHTSADGIEQYLITGSRDGTAQVLDLDTGRCVQTLEGHTNQVGCVYSHPELPIVITGSLDGTVRLWNSITYRLENVIGINLGAVYAFGYIKSLGRLVVGCHQGIAIIGINSP